MQVGKVRYIGRRVVPPPEKEFLLRNSVDPNLVISVDVDDGNKVATYYLLKENEDFRHHARKGDVMVFSSDEDRVIRTKPVFKVFKDENSIHWLFTMSGFKAPFKKVDNIDYPPEEELTFLVKRMWHLVRILKQDLRDHNRRNPLDHMSLPDYITRASLGRPDDYIPHIVNRVSLKFPDMTEDVISHLLRSWISNWVTRRINLLGINEDFSNRTLYRLQEYGLNYNEIYERLSTEVYSIPFLEDKIVSSVVYSSWQYIPSAKVREVRRQLSILYDHMNSTGTNGIPQSEIERKTLLDIEDTSIRDILQRTFRCSFIDYRNQTFMLMENQTRFLEVYRSFVGKQRSHKVFDLDELEDLDIHQRKAITIASKYKYSCITGGAGTGKTTLIRVIFNLFKENGYKVNILAYTGKAVSRVREVMGNKNSGNTILTIHGFLNSRLNPDLVIVDEASMMCSSLFYRLVRFVNDRCRLIFIGDPNQLEPIGTGTPFESLLVNKHIRTVKLKIDHRRGHSDMGKGTDSILDRTVPESGKDYRIFYNQSIEDVYAWIRAAKTAYEDKDIVIISPYRETVKEINDYFIRSMKADKTITDEFGNSFSVGQRVMLTKNFHNMDIYNGDIGYVEKIGEEVVVRFIEREEPVAFKLSEKDINAIGTKDLETSWAITIHKSQGSEFKNVIMFIPKISSFINNKLIYTGMTRASDKLVVLCSCSKDQFSSLISQEGVERYPKILNL